MPRGKYVNHKGRSRHFTSPEELEKEVIVESSSQDESGGEEAAAGSSGATSSSKGRGAKSRPPAGKMPSSSEEEDSDEESSGEEVRDSKKGVASLIEIENPNRAVKKAAQKLNNLRMDGETSKVDLSRREREQIEKQKARLRYEKLHAAGKTSEAKADLARLALIRQQRAEAAAKREAEKKALEHKKSVSKA